jgi:hypothetical protein
MLHNIAKINYLAKAKLIMFLTRLVQYTPKK